MPSRATLRPIVGRLVSVVGAFLVVMALTAGALSFYYRPTIEYVSSNGQWQPMPEWVMSGWAAAAVLILLVAGGAAMLRAGRRLRVR
jgi:hypothetical protein